MRRSHAQALSVPPYTGEVLGEIELSGPVTIPPVVANNTLYFITDGGSLVAMR